MSREIPKNAIDSFNEAIAHSYKWADEYQPKPAKLHRYEIVLLACISFAIGFGGMFLYERALERSHDRVSVSERGSERQNVVCSSSKGSC